MKQYFAEHVWLTDGWHRDVAIDIDHRGHFVALAPNSPCGERERIGRWVVPGMPNLHSHAFQRAMAGLAERQTHPQDSFWTWREVMYDFAQRVDPEQLQSIAAQLYLEMLEAGFTHVCEFNYLHHDRKGQPYADRALMSRALLAAADEVGIGITLLPVLYMTGGFDGRALEPRQRRFGCSVEQYLELLAALQGDDHYRHGLGVCFHSLRAVPEAAMAEVLASQSQPRPVHIHIAEQIAEVDDCLALRGARPVQWLLDHVPVDARWTLVHATHIDAAELAGMVERGVVAGLCPTTEANLGDGFFPLADYSRAGGSWGIGSDSQISVSPVEELRWLEYGQRLLKRSRNIIRWPNMSSGEALFAAALAGGAQASGLDIGRLEDADADAGSLGPRADLIVLDDSAPALLARDPNTLIDSWIFSGNRHAVRDVMVAGHWRVREGRHPLREAVQLRYGRVLQDLQRAV